MKIKLDKRLENGMIEKAKLSERKRYALTLHDKNQNMQLLLNCILRESVVIPHKHEKPDKTEVFHILRGRMKINEFNDKGKVIKSETGIAGDILFTKPRTYHNLEALSNYVIVFICLDGKYNPKTHHKELKVC